MENLTFLFGLASILRPVCGDTAPQTEWKGVGAHHHHLVCVLLQRGKYEAQALSHIVES